MSITPLKAGPYTGAVSASWSLSESAMVSLAHVRDWVERQEEIPSLGRHSLARHSIEVAGKSVALAIKSFSRGSFIQDRVFKKNGSKAQRSFLTAMRLEAHRVGTPRPLAFLDRWEGGRLLESYFVCEYEDQITNFRDELNRLYAEDPLCRRIMSLLEVVALAIADMHDAGVCHRDLGNQNIMLRRLDADTWGDIRFIDLNRAHISEHLTIRQRARDISRIDLPSDFLRVFKAMYFRHTHPPREFHKWEAHYRKRFAFHTASRKYRHPIREARQRKRDALLPYIPRGRELWVWDDRSVQAVSTMLSKERHTYYPARNHFYIASGLIKCLHPVQKRYRELMADSFRNEVALAGRLGMALGTFDGNREQEITLLRDFGSIPVLLRFYHHESEEQRRRTLDEAAELKKAGHPVFAALVQDRNAVRNPERWRSFVESTLPALDGIADWLEIGHAVNRVKWGIWGLDEYRRLVDTVISVAGPRRSFKLCGPAVIDFEYHYLAGLLDLLPQDGGLDALSHHLYVDRRGAPENRQGKFSSIEKFALAKAFAGWSGAIRGDRLIVSEVNWPILDTGVYSPVCSPYTIPNSHTNDPSVDEEDYANYMIRYEMLAICSGMVDAVYWWRLVARGFGLVDDSTPAWRPRPAYHAFKHLRERLGKSTYIGKLDAPEGVWVFRFKNPDDSVTVMAWAHPGTIRWTPGFRYTAMLHRDGHELPVKSSEISLDGAPIYLLGAT